MEINKQTLLTSLNNYAEVAPGVALPFIENLIKEINSGTFDSPSTQEEIAKLKKELNVSDLAHEQAERDFERWKARAIQAEKERDIAVKALKEIVQQEDLIHGEDTVASNLAETALSELRRSTDEATS